jgi:hypothetical protein
MPFDGYHCILEHYHTDIRPSTTHQEYCTGRYAQEDHLGKFEQFKVRDMFRYIRMLMCQN